MRSIQTLRRKAAVGAAWRGHRLKWETFSATVCRGTCIRCGMDVQCETNPAPNDIDIGGPAVAVNCTGRTNARQQ